jgi:hypothetical protein
LSYAQNVDEVYEWIEEELHLSGWQADALSLFQEILSSERSDRPLADELDLRWSPLCASDDSLTYKCAENELMT